MIAPSIEAAFNQHINHEQYSSYLYLSMAAWCERRGLRGFSHWMRGQATEESQHLMKFFDFLLDRGGSVKLQAVPEPPHEWTSPLNVFESAYEHECEVSGRINELVETVMAERDHAANVFLQWFVNEQVEEEASIGDIVSRLRLVGDDGRGILLVDQELAQRKPESVD